MGMEKCKRHPEMWGWPGTPCNKCIAEMGEDCLRRSRFTPPITTRVDPRNPPAWLVDQPVDAPRWPGFRDFLSKLLNRKEKSMQHVFTREISADFQDLTDAGCIVLYKDDGRELFRVVVWPKDKIDPTVSPRTQSLCVNKFLVRYVEGGIHPVALEVLLASLQVPYTVRAYDPSKEKGGEPEKAPRRSITAQLRALQSIKGIRFSGNMDQPGWRVTIPDHEGKPQNFISQASDELTCIVMAATDLTLLEELLQHYRVPYEVGYPVTQISNCTRKAQVASIQVAATRQSDNGFEVVGENDVGRTHWSVYLRDEEGLVTHVEDYKISGFGGPARADALQHAAALSMEHQVPVEPIP